MQRFDALSRRLFGTGVGARTRSFAAGLSSTLPASVVARILSAIGTILTAHILGPALFGRANLALALALWIQIPLFFGLPSAIMHYVPQTDPRERSKWLWTGLRGLILCGGVTLLVVWLCAPQWSRFEQLGTNILHWAVGWCAGFWIFAVGTTLLVAEERFAVRASLEVLFAALFTLITIYYYRIAALTPWHYIVALSTAYAIAGGIGVVLFMKRHPRLSDAWSPLSLGSTMYSYGLITSVGTVINALFQSSGRLVANRYLTIEAVGLLSAYQAGAMQTAQLLNSALSQVYFPLASRTPDKAVLFRKITRGLLISVPLQLIVFTLMVVVYFKFLGRRYQFSLLTAVLFAAAAAANLYQNLLSWHFQAGTRTDLYYSQAVGLFAGVLNLAGCYWLIHRYGLEGAALSTILACTIGALIYHARDAWPWRVRAIPR